MASFAWLDAELSELRSAGLFKSERVISSQQGARFKVGEQSVLNFCANNYLALANHPRLIKAAHSALDQYGYGMASVRFICGTQDVHKALENKLSSFLGQEDTILYSSCFDANGGLFETLLSDEDAVISDALNHASIIDGIRLSKARRFRYKNCDMNDLETQLKAAKAGGARRILIATDGVFSMDGIIANLQDIVSLAETYGALTMVDDSHAVGFVGARGRGSHEHCGVFGKIDILTGTLGKALGGASGGYVSSRKPVTEWLRQRSRPYLFSNTLAPVIAATSIECLSMLEESTELLTRLKDNSARFRSQMSQAGFTLAGDGHPIIPVMLGDASLASKFADALLKEDIYVIGFSYPVVPQGQARIRTQMSSGHSSNDIDDAVQAFVKVAEALNVSLAPRS